MNRIEKAYQTISSAPQRKQYDQERSQLSCSRTITTLNRQAAINTTGFLCQIKSLILWASLTVILLKAPFWITHSSPNIQLGALILVVFTLVWICVRGKLLKK